MEDVVEQSSEELKIESLEDLTKVAESGVEEESQAQPEDSAEVNEPPAYDPSFTYTVRDEQREFDERIRGAIKDKETEDLIRDLYTRADGLDGYKEKLSKRDSEYNALYEQSEALTSGYKTLLDMRNSKDYRGLAEALGLDHDFIVNWGLETIKEEELPEEQKVALNKQREMEAQIKQYESQISDYERVSQEQQVQRDLMEIRNLASSDAYSGIVKAMEEKGLDFLGTVSAEGHKMYLQTGQEPTVRSVVDKVAQQYQWLAQMQQQPEPVAVPQQQQTQPTLPSVDGANQAVVDKPIASMADLKKLADSI